jgi:UDP-N-acetylmuramate dehydrogenase
MQPAVKENVSLKDLNTFGIDVKAKFFVEVHTVEDLQNILHDKDLKNKPRLILGGGSNILFTQDFPGLVIFNKLKGISVVKEDEDFAWIKAASGEIWHEVVLFCIEKGYGGIENLSLIPGTVGAAPIQNIGAYGVELKDTFESLEAMNLQDFSIETFDMNACSFGYRDSIFKREAKGQYFITAIILKLSRRPVLNTSYGAIKTVLEELKIDSPSVEDVSRAVCQIRNSKLPNPKVIGNAGSFFKNPEISAEQFEVLKEDYPDIPGYTVADGNVKVPAGWLIEQCGWKGKRVGNTGSHKDQALVLVNYGEATGDEIRALAMEIRKSVEDKFGISLTPEVNII